MAEILQPQLPYALALGVLKIAPGISLTELRDLDERNPYGIRVIEGANYDRQLGHFINQDGDVNTRANILVEPNGLSKGSRCPVYSLVAIDFVRVTR